ncbi:hypothetical protein, conserved [Plasmodium gonderi]|uniref:Uncharacterized protein n=1 Tax=Plasmodium gonderi TaxID=77519 RepID=A0A1Y1JDT7_PLAGO|nr:hypothetical protein, conserved [Plasmodium gonderi]GAW80681.1 hypothetical protein, conserved [Plasmodium gonderi]
MQSLLPLPNFNMKIRVAWISYQRGTLTKGRDVVRVMEMSRRRYMNIPKRKTLKSMDISSIRKNVELCKKKNVKSKNVWNNYLYILILKLCNKELCNYVDFMIILKLLSKYICIEKKVLNFICEKLEHDMYKLTIRELSLLILILRKNKFDNLYYLNLISKSILIKMNKNLSYKDLALITFSLSRNIDITEKLYTDEIFHLSILKIHNDLKNINFHSLTLFFYSYSLYFLKNFEHFNSFFYMTKNFIQIIKKNIYLFNSTDLMFTFLSSFHIYNSFKNSVKNSKYNNTRNLILRQELPLHLQPSSNSLQKKIPLSTSHRIIDHMMDVHTGNDHALNITSSKSELSKIDLMEKGITKGIPNVGTSTPGEGKIRTSYYGKDSSAEMDLPKLSKDTDANETRNALTCEETVTDLVNRVRDAIMEKLKCFKIEEVINMLFASIDKNVSINKKYFNFLSKDRINIENYLNVYIKTEFKKKNEDGRVSEHENNIDPLLPMDYILKINNNTCEEEEFINTLMEEIIYRNDFLSVKQIILLLYLLKRTNRTYIQFEKIIMKRLVCIEKELTKNEVMFVYQYLYIRTCLFHDLKKYSLKVYEQNGEEKTFLIYDKNRNLEENEFYHETNARNEHKKNNDDTDVYYMHDDVLYLKKKRKRDKNKIFLYDNFIYKYPARVRKNEKSDDIFPHEQNLKYFINLKKTADNCKTVNHSIPVHGAKSSNGKFLIKSQLPQEINSYTINKEVSNNVVDQKNVKSPVWARGTSDLITNFVNCSNVAISRSTNCSSEQCSNYEQFSNSEQCSNSEKCSNFEMAEGKGETCSANGEYKIRCYSLYLDVYKIVCLKLVNSIRNETLTSHNIINILCIYEKLNVRDFRIIKHLYNLEKDILYLNNIYLEKLMNIILKFNLYNILEYLGIHKILQFVNFNSLDECISILKLLGLLISRKKDETGRFSNFSSTCTQNAINYILKNFKKLKSTYELEKIQITPVYNSLPLEYFKLFKNVHSVGTLADLCRSSSTRPESEDGIRNEAEKGARNNMNFSAHVVGQQIYALRKGVKKYPPWSGENDRNDKKDESVSNFFLHHVDDVNIKEVAVGYPNYGLEKMSSTSKMRHLFPNVNGVKGYLTEYRDIKDEIFQDILLIYHKNVEIYKDINISNYYFPLAINLLTLNDVDNIRNAGLVRSLNTCLSESENNRENKQIQELDRKNFLLVDILYNYDFYYSMNDALECKLKKHNIYVSYYGTHTNKVNKKIINYKKYTLLKCVKKIGYNYICIDAKRYVKNKKKCKDNNLNKYYINNLILDLLKRKKKNPFYSKKKRRSKTATVVRGKYPQLHPFTNKWRIYRMQNCKCIRQNVSSYVGRNKYISKKKLGEEALSFSQRIDNNIKGKEVLPSGKNHLHKLRNMFQVS